MWPYGHHSREKEGKGMKTTIYNENKKTVDGFYKFYRKNDDESTFSGLQTDIINSLGSEKKRSWSSPYISLRMLMESK